MLKSYIPDTSGLKAVTGILYRHTIVKHYINIINSLSRYKNLR